MMKLAAFLALLGVAVAGWSIWAMLVLLALGVAAWAWSLAQWMLTPLTPPRR